MFLSLDQELEVVGEAGDGIEATRLIRAELPDTEVVALTSVLEDTLADELCRAIKAAAQGQVQLSPQAAARLMREVRAPNNPEALTERETDVLRLLAEGKADKEIASTLAVGEKTVKTHVSNILAKLGVQSRTQAALFAAQNLADTRARADRTVPDRSGTPEAEPSRSVGWRVRRPGAPGRAGEGAPGRRSRRFRRSCRA